MSEAALIWALKQVLEENRSCIEMVRQFIERSRNEKECPKG